eukprot:scaffold1169_cov367-Prasinococcus_capsulatus_cf.AAC.9
MGRAGDGELVWPGPRARRIAVSNNNNHDDDDGRPDQPWPGAALALGALQGRLNSQSGDARPALRPHTVTATRSAGVGACAAAPRAELCARARDNNNQRQRAGQKAPCSGDSRAVAPGACGWGQRALAAATVGASGAAAARVRACEVPCWRK